MKASRFTEEQVAFGLKQAEPRFILDSEGAMGGGYSSETLLVLKKREQRHSGEYRTQRLVLATWDRMKQGEL